MLPAHVPRIDPERRSKTRYPLQLTVHYRTIDRSHRISGIGQTLNLSSGGLLFAGAHMLRIGQRVEVAMEWPFLLDSTIPLQLTIVGSVVHTDGPTCGMAFAGYQFRTMRRSQDHKARVWINRTITS